MVSHSKSDLSPFFEPRSVAVLGSLKKVGEGYMTKGGEGYTVVENLLRFGFAGGIYPINPSYSEVLGLRTYPAVNDVNDPIDLAMVITPPSTVLAVIEQCAQKGIKAVIVGTEGFAEVGETGARLQQQLVDLAHRLGLRLLGPNTIGVLNSSNGLITNPYLVSYSKLIKGNIAFASQSGFVGAQGQALEDRAYPISKMCDFGNKCDVDEADLLDYLLEDRETKAVSLHMEAVKAGRRFMAALRRLAAHKPVLIFKTARTAQGARASASHTGSLAGSTSVYDAAFKQAGAIPVHTWQEYWELPRVFASQPLPRGNRLAIVTPTGGVGVVAADAAVEAGLTVARLSPGTIARLKSFHPNLSGNPLDLGPTMVLVEDPVSILEAAIGAVLDDANVDCAAIVLAAGTQWWARALLDTISRLRQRISKPVTIYIYGTQLSISEEVVRQLGALGLPAYLELETAIKALGVAFEYATIKAKLDPSPRSG